MVSPSWELCMPVGIVKVAFMPFMFPSYLLIYLKDRSHI